MPSVTLKPGREKSLLRCHPWVFSGAIERVDGTPDTGATVEVVGADGRWLARGAWSPESQIRVRLWTFDRAEPVDAALLRRRLSRAMEARRGLLSDGPAVGVRLVNAESDGLPGLIVDRYGPYLVCQFLAAGTEHWKRAITEELRAITAAVGIYERSDADVRHKEGLEPVCGLLAGAEPPEFIEIAEGASRYLVDVRNGHKTGFYLDQRDNRAALAACSRDAEVLNVFSYTGGFGIAALCAGARRVVNIDSSLPALALLKRNAALNGIAAERLECSEADAFSLLRTYRDMARSFDIIVLDPPKFVGSQHQMDGGCRGYKDINLQALKLVRSGGLLCTFSCSGLVSAELFQKIVADAALDAKREAHIVRRLSQSSDHPVILSFPEGTYLKGLLCRVW